MKYNYSNKKKIELSNLEKTFIQKIKNPAYIISPKKNTKINPTINSSEMG